MIGYPLNPKIVLLGKKYWYTLDHHTCPCDTYERGVSQLQHDWKVVMVHNLETSIMVEFMVCEDLRSLFIFKKNILKIYKLRKIKKGLELI